MKEMRDVWEDLKRQDLEKYRETMEYCKTRVTSDEGIPAVLGLDDLTASWADVWQGPETEREFHKAMAAAAMVFASLYEQLDPEELGHYPGIAPAMSALAELFFLPGDGGEAIPYRSVVKELLREEQKGLSGNAGEAMPNLSVERECFKEDQKGGE